MILIEAMVFERHIRMSKKWRQVMSITTWLLISVFIGIAILGIAALIFHQKRRTKDCALGLAPNMGAPCTKAGTTGGWLKPVLKSARKRLRREFSRPTARARRWYALTESWRGVQARFVDDPRVAVTEADQLLGDVMFTRGYPVSDFEQRTADMSRGPTTALSFGQPARVAAQVR